jgi:hypothetical protein
MVMIKKWEHGIEAGFIYHYGYYHQVMIILLKALSFILSFIFHYAYF